MITIAEQQARAMLPQFALEEEYTDIREARELTEGHINSTYYVEAQGAAGPRGYILQKINTYVFRRPEELMANIVGVTEYIRERLAAGEARGQSTLHVYPAKDGNPWYQDEQGGYWRCYNFVANSYSLQAAAGPQEARRAAYAFGTFQRMLDGFPIERLHETIPDFHNTKKRYEALEAAVAEDRAGRRAEVEDEIAFARARKGDCLLLPPLVAAGSIPLRVTHNDTKLNNVLFDRDTHEAVCVVDLDTIMPGLSLYDFGDSLRFLGNTAAEDERDLSNVDFSLPLFEAYTKGYLAACGAALTPDEIRLLPFSVKLMTYECGMRFLTDYLNGDVYFRIHRPDDNLARCRTQFALVRRIEALLPEMERIVAQN
ncbi:MAG: aminoglycoside phosphotransferase family protein [Oscillospiraceae bacterium]|jgi:hypothetical protein|nr:aminoglycoside phosphotransferase family protein [Oscillospiraceae bacterium]